MNNNSEWPQGTEGRLPQRAPLANPFVPFQEVNPPIYDARKGLIRGTLYPGLDLPFMGMVNQKEKPNTLSSQLQTLCFAIQELALYLDTHRDDQDAVELYRAYQKLYQQVATDYRDKYGPLNHQMPSEGPYRWLDDPWPWEITGNKEG